jgi:hypothetical protein
MDETTNGKELMLFETAEITKRSKPSLIEVAGRYLSSDMKWHHDLAADYLMANGRTRMLPVGELAKTFFGANIPSHKAKVRKRLSGVFRKLLDRRELLVYEIDQTTGRIQAVKLYDPKSEADRQSIQAKLERMETRELLSQRQFHLALQLVAATETAIAVGV